MRFVLDYAARLVRHRPPKMVRPWALAAPVLVLLVALPLLRPLRYPSPFQMSDDEKARLATVQAIVEHGTLSIDATDFTTTQAKVEVRDRKADPNQRPPRDHWYADQPPTMAALLSASYWVMYRNGLTLARDGPMVMYLLTILGSALPAACAAGLIYRMSRLFELRRPWRAALAAAAVLATGLISYATVLNPHAPAAALVLAAAACLVHVTISPRKPNRALWCGVAGICAALGAAIDPSGIPFLPLFIPVIVSIRWRARARLGGVAAFLLGAAMPIAFHGMLTAWATGDFLQGIGYNPPARQLAAAGPGNSLAPAASPDPADDPDAAPPALPRRVLSALVGAHGLLSHFPVLVLGVVGVGMVMHRHWPMAAKVLASATVAGAVFLVVACAAHRGDPGDWRDAMFAARWFVVFGPLVLFWSGAWLKRSHRTFAWVAVGVLLAFSTAVSVVGAAAGPLPEDGFGFGRYTAADAWDRLTHPPGPGRLPPVVASR